RPTNFLALANDEVRLSGKAYSLSQFATGVTLTDRYMGLTLAADGAPIARAADGSYSTTVSLGAEVSEAGSGRLLQLQVDQLTLTQSGSQIVPLIPNGATLYAYARTTSGKTSNVRM